MISQSTNSYSLDLAAERIVAAYADGLRELIGIWLEKNANGNVSVEVIQRAVSWASDVFANDDIRIDHANGGKVVPLRDLRNELASLI